MLDSKTVCTTKMGRTGILHLLVRIHLIRLYELFIQENLNMIYIHCRNPNS